MCSSSNGLSQVCAPYKLLLLLLELLVKCFGVVIWLLLTVHPTAVMGGTAQRTRCPTLTLFQPEYLFFCASMLTRLLSDGV